jgi:hypothetical protein
VDVAIFIRTLTTQNISLSVEGDQLRVEYNDNIDLTEATRQELKQHKLKIVSYLMKTKFEERIEGMNSQLAVESIPQCFLDSPCRCGKYHAIKDAEHGWISPCYFLALEESKKPRPPMPDHISEDRGLPDKCSRCGHPAVWWEDGCVPYCGHCWRYLGKMKWYMEPSSERRIETLDAAALHIKSDLHTKSGVCT